jgi:hypothetical protein
MGGCQYVPSPHKPEPERIDGWSENIERIYEICKKRVPVVVTGKDEYGHPSISEESRQKYQACEKQEGNKIYHLLNREERRILGLPYRLREVTDNAEKLAKEWCEANPGECADDDAAQRVCGSSSRGWRSGDAWSYCLGKEREKAKQRRLNREGRD